MSTTTAPGTSSVVHGRGWEACIPLPLQIVIDDVGWWDGRDGSAMQEPYRSGIGRPHTPADYEALALLGKRLGMRPQIAMVLCEWDRHNRLRESSTATWMGRNWDNRRWVGPWLDQAAQIIRDNAAHLEVALHGVGHEYWQDGHLTRAEWYDAAGHMRPRGEVQQHLDLYYALLEDNDLPTELESFVPAAFLYAFGDDGLAPILTERGISFCSTPFAGMRCCRRPETVAFGIDGRLLTVDRGDAGIPWNSVAATPPQTIDGPILGLHWPNVLHSNPQRNGDVIEPSVERVLAHGAQFGNILARDTHTFATQLTHRVLANLRAEGDVLHCDLTALRRLAPPAVDSGYAVRIRSRSKVRAVPVTQDVSAHLLSAADETSTWQITVPPGARDASVRLIFATTSVA